MILQSPVLSVIRPDTVPEEDDSNIRVPNIILPTITLRQPLRVSSINYSIAQSWPVTDRLTNSALIQWQDQRINQGTSLGNLWVILGPGIWEVTIQANMDSDYLEPVVSNQSAIFMQDETPTGVVGILWMRPLLNVGQRHPPLVVVIAVQTQMRFSVSLIGNRIGQTMQFRAIGFFNRLH